MIKKIDGTTRLCGVMGNPIAHTLSPFIHNALAEKMGQNLVYVAFHVKERLADAVKGAYALNVLGMNVTVPYKSEVMQSLVEIDEAARSIGAVNTLVRVDGGYKGYNTDYYGLGRAMQEDGVTLKEKPVLLLGAGGAAKAAAYLCASMSANELYIVNRSLDKGEALAAYIAKCFPQFPVKAVSLSEAASLPRQNYTAIQATNIGMFPNAGVTQLNEAGVYDRIDEAIDLIFNPAETEFMKRVKQAGGRSVNGLKMLLYQGVTAYELWNDVKVEESFLKELYALLKKELESHG